MRATGFRSRDPAQPNPSSAAVSGDASGRPRPRRFVLVAGEASGDLLGAGLIRELRARYPDAQFAGVGGAAMVAAGLQAWYPAERLALMGLVEILPHLFGLLALRRDVARRALAFAPDAFVGIDAPDFNLGLERRLKRAGVRTVHYVSPSVWAWRERRAAKIGRSADRVLCLFPIEPPIYARHGVDARFVGHPLAASLPLEPDRAAARRALGIDAQARVLALLPGSRLGEIARLGSDFVAAAGLLRRTMPDLQVIAPMANAACATAFAALLSESASGATPAADAVRLLGPATDATATCTASQLAMIAADAVLLASGTAALEAMLAKRPMVVAYRVAPLTYRIVTGLGLLKVDRYSLPNILAGRALVPELMQDACTPPALAAALAPLLQGDVDPRLLDEFRRLHRALQGDREHDAAAAIAALIDSPPAARSRRR